MPLSPQAPSPTTPGRGRIFIHHKNRETGLILVNPWEIEVKMLDFDITIAKNKESLQMYRDFLATCTDADLSTPMPAGWTVSAVLCHLAFWDQRALTLLEKWEKGGIDFSSIDTDVVNEVTRSLCLAVSPRAAVDLFLRTAETLDAKIAALDPAWLPEIEEKGKNVHIYRAKHREMHMEDIRAILGKA